MAMAPAERERPVPPSPSVKLLPPTSTPKESVSGSWRRTHRLRFPSSPTATDTGSPAPTPSETRDSCRFWTPLITTYFIFILTCNFLGLIPLFDLIPGGSSTVTGNFNSTAALATITFFAIIFAGTMKHGLLGYWKNMIPSGVPGPVLLILIPIEILGMFVRPFALTMRLGANMTAGHIGMLAIFALPIILSAASIGIASIVLNTGIYFLEMIVSFVQAYVFTLLSSVFIGMAIHAEH